MSSATMTETKVVRIIHTLKGAFETVEAEVKGLPDHWRKPTLTLLEAYRQGLAIYEKGYVDAFHKEL